MPHALADRHRRVLDLMAHAGIDRLVCCGNGHHMIDLDSPVAHMAGYRSVGPTLLVLEGDGRTRLVTSLADEVDADAERAVDEARAVEDIGAAARDLLRESGRAATVGLQDMPRRLAQAILAALDGHARSLDHDFLAATAAKTDAEIAAARKATAIAEQGYLRLLEIVRPGMRECDLAIELNLYMRMLGANDSFLMLNCGPRQDAVMPSSERPIEVGDLLLCELSPSVEGQFTQICRTVSIGASTGETTEKYPLLVAAMNEGIAQVRPGARLGDVCQAIDDHLSKAGYETFSRPPFIRRRGHGLGCGSTAPGDVSVDNDTVLEPGMLFMVHPNQFLPETGYMMCGEPVLVTATGHEVLTRERAALAAVDGRRA
jgi:Xaa-Pro aminopeptidase